MSARWRPALLSVGALALAWLAWTAAGWAADAAGFGELGLPACACAVFVALTLGEAVLARLHGQFH